MSSYDSQTATTLINKLRKDVDSLTLKIAVLTDSKASGTGGGTGVATTWTTRELNTIAVDPQGLIIQLESNTFKLAAGSYQVRAIAAFKHTRETRMRLYDVTNAVVIGYSVSVDVSNQSNQYLDLNVRIAPHKDTVYRLEYYITSSGADHLGVPTSLATIDETFAICEITRLDTGATKPLGAGGLQGPQGPPGPTGPAGPPGPTGGGVTSVNVSGGFTGLTTSGGPITTSGTITLGGILNVASGGTGATTEAAALTSLGAYPASNPSGYTSNVGTVTSVSVTTANGVSGTVANPSSTPAISLILGAITPTSVAASGAVTGSNLSGNNTGDQTITLTGDVTGSGTGSFPATIANDAVTYAKMQNVSGASLLLGRGAGAGGGDVQEISLGTNLTMSGTTLNAAVASGTVTSVDASGGTTGLTFSGGPVTSIGTLTLSGTLDVDNGGTGGTTASDARTNLGLVIGTDIPAPNGAGATGTWNIDVLGSASTITSTLPLNKGGTGATTAAGALTNLGAYPNSNPAGYTSNVGTVTNVSASGGANISVATGGTTPVISQNAASSVSNGYMTSAYAAKLDGIQPNASVSSVGVSGGTTGLTTSGGPITTSGTITLGGILNVASGGTGATTEAAALTSLGAYPASNPSGYTSNVGTVTSVSVTTANGVSGTVANPSSTPAISLSLGAITPTSVAASGAVTGSNLSGNNTGDQLITLTGDVTGSGTTSFAATIANDAVTYSKIQNVSGASLLLGRGAGAGGGDVQEISLGTNLTMSGTTLNAAVASGTVTSVAASGGTTGLTFSGSPITSLGTLTLGGTLAVASGGTGGTTASDARTNLGLVIGTDIPSPTGTGATGTWNIDVLGSAGTITSTLPVNKGGTGATTAAGALTNLGAYPATNPNGYTANVGTVTTVSASGSANISVATGSTTPVISQNAASSVSNGYMTSTYAAKLDSITSNASVSSVGVSGGTTGLTTSGGPVTTSGTITLGGILSVANGGTGSTSQQSAIDYLAGSTINGRYLRGNGTNVVMSTIQAVDLPLISMSSGVTGTLGVTNGGTGQTNSFTNGDLLIGNTTGGTLNKAKLTAGTNITITNGAGSITIAATGTGTGDVVGPSSSGANAIAVFADTTGKEIASTSWSIASNDLYGGAGATSMQTGFLWIPAASGPPTGTVSQAGTLNNRVPLFFDTNSEILYVYSNSAWIAIN